MRLGDDGLDGKAKKCESIVAQMQANNGASWKDGSGKLGARTGYWNHKKRLCCVFVHFLFSSFPAGLVERGEEGVVRERLHAIRLVALQI